MATLANNFCLYVLLIVSWLQILTVNCTNDAEPIINNVPDVDHPPAEKGHKVTYYISDPWVIAVSTVVGIVVIFNIAMICYLQCSPASGFGRAYFFNKNVRKGYSNVAVDSEDFSSSEMEQIDID